jgi:hypothetical protein
MGDERWDEKFYFYFPTSHFSLPISIFRLHRYKSVLQALGFYPYAWDLVQPRARVSRHRFVPIIY